MDLKVVSKPLQEVNTELLVLTIFEDQLDDLSYFAPLNEAINGKVSKMIETGEVKGKFREFTLLHTEGVGPKRVLIMGMGKRSEFSLDRVRSIAANSSRYARRIQAGEMAIHDFASSEVLPEDSGSAIVEGVILGMYRFDKYKSKKKDASKLLNTIKIVTQDAEQIEGLKASAQIGRTLAESVNYVRDLVNEPGGSMTPTVFAESAQKMAAQYGISIRVLEEDEMKAEGMGAYLAVSQGSDEPAKMVIMEYKGDPDAKTIGIVGKGVTFDSGGYDIKPSNAMLRMYSDMAGAAATLGTLISVAREKLPINVVGIMSMTENLVNGKAFKPSDILHSMSGKTIEVLNTDAEGRLVLADSLTYLQKYYKVDALVDIATLTGAAIIALGRTVSACLTNSNDLYKRLFEAGEYSGERVWRLPLYQEYRAQLVSDVADIESVGGRSAGTITAAIFLKEFIEKGQPWAHIDIAGTSMMEEEIARYVKNPYLPKEGGTGTGTRLLYHFIESFIED